MLDADLSLTLNFSRLARQTLTKVFVPVHLVVICLSSFLLLWRRFVVGWLMVVFNNLCASLFDDGYGVQTLCRCRCRCVGVDSKHGLLHDAALLSIISHDLTSIGPSCSVLEAPVRSLQVSDLMVILRR